MVPLNEYELQRLQRIEENRRRMEELGVVEASQDIAASQAAAQASQAAPRAPRRPPQFVEVKEEDLRRSVRVKKEVNYNEHNLFKDAEAALRQAEARERKIVVRKGGSRGSRGEALGVRARGWHESYGMAGHEAQEQCIQEAYKLADSLDNPAFMKVLTASMVSGGFWCSAPRGLKGAVGAADKCVFTAYLPEGEPIPKDAQRYNKAVGGWDIVWLPHGKPKGSSFGFSGNWVGFSVDNRLFPGDCMVCEVLPQEEHRAPTSFSLRFHVLRAYDYDTAEVKAACQAAWGTAFPIKQEEHAAVEEEMGPQEAEQGEEKEEKHPLPQQQQQRSEGSPAAVAAAAAQLSEQGRQAEEEGEHAQGQEAAAAPVAAPAAAPGPSAPRRKRQMQMTEAASSKRPRRTSAASKATAAAAAEQQPKPKGPATAEPGARAAKQRPAKKEAEKKGRGGGKKAAARKGKRASAAAADAAAAAQVQGAGEGQQQEEEEQAYEVECILGVKGRGAGRRVHIKWWGYEETTWEPLSMLDCPLETYPLAPGLKL
ncbi:hypothetical protein ABPG75_005805 [Micractinium tetrahymenae]